MDFRTGASVNKYLRRLLPVAAGAAADVILFAHVSRVAGDDGSWLHGDGEHES